MPGAIIYEGPSQFDGAPIFVAAIWSSANRKTGDMVQTYIMRADLPPTEANKLGEDASICGTCTLRGNPTLDPDKKQATERPCYVVLGQGPLIVYRAYLRGAYPLRLAPHEVYAIGHDRVVRIGTYGDGAAVPLYIWRTLIAGAKGYTAYTHAVPNPAPDIFMTSADTPADAQAAWERGERTFRVLRNNEMRVPRVEAMCPNVTHGVQCAQCLLCGGTSRTGKSIVIPKHGPGAVHFK